MEATIREYRPGDDAAYLEAMHDKCRRYHGRILLAEVDDAVAGLVMTLARVPFEELDERPGAHALVAELVVQRAQRGRGIGGALLRAGEAWAREASATELRIAVLSENNVETLTKDLGSR